MDLRLAPAEYGIIGVAVMMMNYSGVGVGTT